MIRLALVAAVALAVPALAGPLNPPAGPIAPTGKPLDEVEPRIAIKATNTPGDADSVFRITQPGSYYLTADLIGEAGKHGIQVEPSVIYATIDLNGFRLTGVPTSLDGVNAPGVALTLKNGVVFAWPGLGVRAGVQCTIHNVEVTGCGAGGILCSNAASITSCRVLSNGNLGNAYGIGTGMVSMVSDCIVQANGGPSGGGGISVGPNSRVERCVVIANANSATVSATAYGILTSFDSVVTDCRVNGNGASAAPNTGGVRGGPGTAVTNCNLYSNFNSGIRVDSQAFIVSNSVGATSPGVGIAADGANGRVDSNHVFNCQTGYTAATNGGNVIVRNSARANITNYNIAPGNDVGPIGAAAASTSPWANLQS